MTKFDLLTRRSVVIGALGAVIAGTLAGAGGAEEGGDTGLIREDWFLASAFDLGADLRLAASRNKRLAVLWEVNGNPLCAETHIKTLGDAAIAAFIHARFEIVQFDAAGVRDITDFDGEKLPEKALAAKYGVRMTPTLQFFADTTDAIAAKPARQREVARLQGYVEPRHILAVCRFVAEKAYDTMPLRDYLKALPI
ncbi:thioredoxin family protein [Blastochloris viridis]|uniref:Thioredoxin SoxW n=1 Tax=Blastochloris viridis TaxID=1079 RepID=A0A0H5BQC3_BLAVI|nr:thioredoxin fold domain-containing protein [Blastochloris viridis]ALK09420.1 hypothetical protein BVIR_1641 [Blastochloris viridis]BAS00699.1 thioredoxin SoxW [Blastochloris viridis]CUU42083.1 Thioredoxin-related protein [Blastochloris viridis]